MRLIDLTGNRYGRLTVISYAGHSKWNCLCDCGQTRVVAGAGMKNGATRSCGCLRVATVADKNRRNARHGMTKTRPYRIWYDMRRRCYYPKQPEYENYGGRGISVCEEWRDSFEAFYEWATKAGYADHLTLDRINNDGNYEPSNCRWATYKEQANNKRKRRINA